MNKPELVRYHTDEGVYSSLVLRPERRRKFLKVVILNGALRVRKVPLEDEQHMRPLAMSESRARTSFRQAACNLGCTPQARKIVYAF